ncbi:hypothetical protein AMAG_13849 [Allomyces macrogynus ATCC 38327]|uniref:Uncharacterized protein n=1 Tax=Allomyces macrogynus (strain ATCC 38327) TaxID=578462 RepID=A0A0L0T2C3_ALLM3|nr:hypothetical protein AMAG_13849 [Allomyces macrogynus ATCC 38327]|eukprot:KNE68973.1 hypothetical protein AMAG_13849 [Allomyces macrogynus ATCC 38327]
MPVSARRARRSTATALAVTLVVALAVLLVTIVAPAPVLALPQVDVDVDPSPEGGASDFIDDVIDEQLMINRICFAMNARNSIPGGQDAYVELTYIPPSTGTATLAVYNILDQGLLGGKLPPPDDFGYLCTDAGVQAGMCPEVGRVLFRNATADGTRPPHAPLFTKVLKFKEVTLPYRVRYDVTVTGLYCMIGMPLGGFDEDAEVMATIKYVNAHGLLPAVDYPKLPFYGVTCLVYLGVFLMWMAKSALHWNEILPVQKYISGVIGFLVLETATNYWYLSDWNTHGEQSWALLFLSAIMNSARNSVSLFILLIVAMGYGVVKPSLGDDMKKCQLLAAVHLVFGALYAGFTLKQSDHKGFGILLVIIPLAITLTLFYVGTLSALTATTQHLEMRRQHFKLAMYKNLWRLLFFAGLNLVAFFVVNSVWFSKRDDVVFLARWWRWRWLLVDGWLNLLYTVCMLAICLLWRPTSNNARYGLEELVSDPLEDEFELDVPDLFDQHAERYPGANKRRGDPLAEQTVVFALDSDTDDSDDDVTGPMHGGAAGNGSPTRVALASGMGQAAAHLRSRSPSPIRGGGGRVAPDGKY